jgi:hypothetical protein
MSRFGIMKPVNAVASVAMSVGAHVVEGAQDVLGGDVKPAPRPMRELLLAMEGSVHGRIPDILGDSEEERIATILRFLTGASEEDMNEILRLTMIAIERANTQRFAVPA